MRESARLAQFIGSTPYDQLPPAIVEQAKRLILDYLAAGYLGSRAETSPAYRRLFGVDDRGGWVTLGARAGVAGSRPSALSAGAAAALNAAYGHQVELAEGVSRAVVHSSNAVVPAALAVAEREGSTGPELIRAVALGCEALIRWGYSLNSDPSRPPKGDNPVTYKAGWWTPAALAPLGAATAVAALRGGTGDDVERAWDLAVNACLTVTRGLVHDGGSGKGFILGLACLNGILSGDLALEGITGADDIEAAWLPLINPHADLLRLSDGLGSRYELDFVLYKYFATPGPLFASLEAVFALLERDGAIDPADIASIHIAGYRRTREFHRDAPPPNAEAARADVGYCVARAFVSADPNDFLESAFTDEAIHDPLTLDLASRLTVDIDPHFDSLYPREAAWARLTVALRDGSAREIEVDRDALKRYHYPERTETAAKFRAVATLDLGSEGADEVVDAVWNLEAPEGAARLIAALRGGPTA
jgi:2-methylcitrate dehydratase PrpD